MFCFQEKSKEKGVKAATNVPPLSVFVSPLKALPKAPKLETLKADLKPTEKKKLDESKQAANNNKTSSNIAIVNESDDDDSVFINENKAKKANKTPAKAKPNVVPVPCDAPSVMLSASNVSSSNIKTLAPAATQNHNSRDLNVKSETVVR